MIYLLPVAFYVFVKIVILKIDNQLLISYFLNYELQSVLGFPIGYTLFYYFVIKNRPLYILILRSA
ncbi:hypothetical protein IGK74_002134 [Enterococcus sp. AZ150]|uniref:Uncharacterized protein n=1 Tax=Enterococcus sulfureus ATCC 49903 TaxID=1140003 RepID=S0KZL2_9ENTE|nr:hypothetical protein OMY_01639 [Enterococcus sulfureus ATCC 49903]EOT86197.1 hypothetical protein I573_00950 [Enterococcus sulfureus ATCC 49903]